MADSVRPPKGRANHPHNSKRPAPKAVLRAVERMDAKALKIALTPRQSAFAREYIVDFNGAAAAIRAGYSPNHVDKQAYNLLQHEGVRAYIDSLTASQESKIQSVSPDYVLQQVTAIINKPEARDGDRLRGLELLARHLGMFIERTEITGKDGGAIEIENRKIEEEANTFTSLIKKMAERAKTEAEATTH
jgi:phage terminase small subunit